MPSTNRNPDLLHMCFELPSNTITMFPSVFLSVGLSLQLHRSWKWSGSFFKTITKVLDGISGITKNIFLFHLRVCEWWNFDFCVFLRMCSGSGGRVLVRNLAGMTTARRDGVRSLHSAYINRFLTGILIIRKNTQKSKFLLSQTFKWKKIMFFVIPEMPSKSFVML